jgi:hypothetical protein
MTLGTKGFIVFDSVERQLRQIIPDFAWLVFCVDGLTLSILGRLLRKKGGNDDDIRFVAIAY